MADFAAQSGRQFNVWVPGGTKLSGPLQAAVAAGKVTLKRSSYVQTVQKHHGRRVASKARGRSRIRPQKDRAGEGSSRALRPVKSGASPSFSRSCRIWRES